MTRSDARDENCVDNLNDLHNLCRAFKAAVGAIEVWNDRGQGIGTGFHIGNGYMITAAHVLDGASRATLAFHDMIDRELPAEPLENYVDFQRHFEARHRPQEIDLSQVVYHDGGADIALFRSHVFAANLRSLFRPSRHWSHMSSASAPSLTATIPGGPPSSSRAYHAAASAAHR